MARLLPAAILLACLLPLLPLIATPLPPLLDYPNHLARLWLIAGGAAGTPLAEIYAVDWSLAWVNIGIDLGARALGPWLGADRVGQGAIALALLLPGLGFVLLGRVLAGRWHALLLLGPLLVWNAALALGFLNQQIAIGLALLLATADFALRRTAPPRASRHTPSHLAPPGAADPTPPRATQHTPSHAPQLAPASAAHPTPPRVTQHTAPIAARLNSPHAAGHARPRTAHHVSPSAAHHAPLRGARLALATLAGAALSVIHPVGALTLAALLGAIALGPTLPPWPALPRALLRALAAAAPVLLTALALALIAPTPPGADARSTAPPGLHVPEEKLLALLAGLAFLAVLILSQGVGWLRLHAGLALAALAALALLLLLPSNLGDTGQVTQRLGALATLLAALSLQPGPMPPRARWALAALLLLAQAGRTLTIGLQWTRGAQEITAVEQALAALPPGVALLSVVRRDGPGERLAGGEPLSTHYPLRAIPLAQAFVPTLFAASGKQPIRVLPPWSRLAVPDGLLPEPADLTAPMDAERHHNHPYLATWRQDFTHLLLLDAEGAPPPAPGLEPLTDTGFARLYRIPR